MKFCSIGPYTLLTCLKFEMWSRLYVSVHSLSVLIVYVWSVPMSSVRVWSVPLWNVSVWSVSVLKL